MNRKLNLFLTSLIGAIVITPFNLAKAAAVGSRLLNVVDSQPTYNVDTTTNTLTDYIGLLISVFLGLLGVIFVILLLYGGYTWMTAAGNAEKSSKGGKVLKTSIIGLLVTIAVYAIWVFLFKRLVSL